jgi:hypothetical protein
MRNIPQRTRRLTNYPSVIFWVHRKVKPIVLTKEPVREFPGLQRVMPLSMLLELCRPLVLGIFLITPRTQYLQRRCILKWAQAARKPSLTMNQIEKAWKLENHDGISIYSDISSFDGSRTQVMMEDFDEEYTPENPTINEPTLRSITMVPGEVNIEYNSLEPNSRILRARC